MAKRGSNDDVPSSEVGTESQDPGKRLKCDPPKALAMWKEIRNNGGLRFEVTGLPGSSFCSFVEQNSKEDVVRFFREVVEELEEKRGVLDYHLKLREQKQWFCVEIFFGEEKENPEAAAAGKCISCFADAPLFPGKEPGVTAGECVLPEFGDQPHVHCSLDAKARSGFIITPVRHVERISELQDEELFALWSTAVRALRQDKVPFRTMIVNHGTYRNTPHLHLKVWVDDELHEKVRSNWTTEKVDLWNRLLAMVGTLPKKPCRSFEKWGVCGYGERCRFSHVTQRWDA